jgi:hypothetical protein
MISTLLMIITITSFVSKFKNHTIFEIQTSESVTNILTRCSILFHIWEVSMSEGWLSWQTTSHTLSLYPCFSVRILHVSSFFDASRLTFCPHFSFTSIGHWIFNWPNPSSRTMALGSAQPLTEMSNKTLHGGKGRPTRGADNFTATCEPII